MPYLSFEPFIAGLFSGNFDRQMGEPGIRSGAVPVFHPGRDIDDGSGRHQDRIFAPFLIITASADADEHLPASAFRQMNVPVIAASGLKGDIVNRDLLR